MRRKELLLIACAVAVIATGCSNEGNVKQKAITSVSNEVATGSIEEEDELDSSSTENDEENEESVDELENEEYDDEEYEENENSLDLYLNGKYIKYRYGMTLKELIEETGYIIQTDYFGTSSNPEYGNYLLDSKENEGYIKIGDSECGIWVNEADGMIMFVGSSLETDIKKGDIIKAVNGHVYNPSGGEITYPNPSGNMPYDNYRDYFCEAVKNTFIYGATMDDDVIVARRTSEGYVRGISCDVYKDVEFTVQDKDTNEIVTKKADVWLDCNVPGVYVDVEALRDDDRDYVYDEKGELVYNADCEIGYIELSGKETAGNNYIAGVELGKTTREEIAQKYEEKDYDDSGYDEYSYGEYSIGSGDMYIELEVCYNKDLIAERVYIQ